MRPTTRQPKAAPAKKELHGAALAAHNRKLAAAAGNGEKAEAEAEAKPLHGAALAAHERKLAAEGAAEAEEEEEAPEAPEAEAEAKPLHGAALAAHERKLAAEGAAEAEEEEEAPEAEAEAKPAAKPTRKRRAPAIPTTSGEPGDVIDAETRAEMKLEADLVAEAEAKGHERLHALSSEGKGPKAAAEEEEAPEAEAEAKPLHGAALAAHKRKLAAEGAAEAEEEEEAPEAEAEAKPLHGAALAAHERKLAAEGAAEAEEEEEAEAQPASRVCEHVPPKAAQTNAQRGLDLREQWKRGGLTHEEASAAGIDSGLDRAEQLAAGKALPDDVIMKMAHFTRSRHNYHPEKTEADGGPTAGTIAWLLWGGTEGVDWAIRQAECIQAA